MAVFLRHHPLEEAGEEAGAEHADLMCWHLASQQPGHRVPADVSVNLQQGVAFTLVLRQERRSHPLARVHRAPHRRGPRLVEEVGVPEKDKRIQDHLAAIRILKKEGHEGVEDHRRLPYAKGGTADEPRASPIPDGAQSVTRWDGACR